jgi:hypothetical protein
MEGPVEGARRLAARHPVVWHAIEAEGLDGARRHGLLPACELRRRAGLPASHANREDFEVLTLADGTVAVLRFQQMPDARLAPTLSGQFAGRPEAWRALIDAQVYFWVDQDRCLRFLRRAAQARAASRTTPSDAPAAVLALDTAALLHHAGELAHVSFFNTGSTVLGGGRTRRRNESAFLPASEYRHGSVAELAVRGRVDLGRVAYSVQA